MARSKRMDYTSLEDAPRLTTADLERFLALEDTGVDPDEE